MNLNKMYSVGGDGMTEDEQNTITKLGNYIGRKIQAILKQYFNFYETGGKMVAMGFPGSEEGLLLFVYTEKSKLYFQVSPKTGKEEDFTDAEISLIPPSEKEIREKIDQAINSVVPKTRTDLN